MSALSLATLGVQCQTRAVSMATLGVFCFEEDLITHTYDRFRYYTDLAIREDEELCIIARAFIQVISCQKH